MGTGLRNIGSIDLLFAAKHCYENFWDVLWWSSELIANNVLILNQSRLEVSSIEANVVSLKDETYMKTILKVDEKLVKKSPANHQRGIETVGGMLYLTTERLIFESHSLNFQTGETIISIPEINNLRKNWTKFLGIIPIFPNTLVVTSGSGHEDNFVLFRRTTWINEINKLKGGLN